MADTFEDQLRSELAGIQGQMEALEKKRELIQQLLNVGGEPPKAAPKQPQRRRAARRGGGAAAPRQRRPRGLITNKVREYLASQSEPRHATEILAYLESQDAAPQSAKPLPTLQSTLQRMKELGEVENAGRNRWSKAGASSPTPAAAAPSTPRPPQVVTSQRTFGSRG